MGPETFTDLVLTPPQEKDVLKGQVMPTIQGLINQRLQFEYLDDDNMLECHACNKRQRHGKWCEIVSPPQHLCLCISRFSFDMKTYELYMVIIHTGKTATSGHYYAIGKRSEHPDTP